MVFSDQFRGPHPKQTPKPVLRLEQIKQQSWLFQTVDRFTLKATSKQATTKQATANMPQSIVCHTTYTIRRREP